MPEGLAQFLFQENFWLTLGLMLSGSAAMYYWIRPADPGVVEPLSAVQMLNSAQGLYLDVRSREEFDKGRIVNSKNVPLSELETKIGGLDKFKKRPVVVVCERGSQAPTAVSKLRAGGFERVFRIRGGMQAWRTANLPVVRK